MSEQPFNGDGALEADVTLPGSDAADQEEMPKLQLRGQHALLFGFFVISALAFLYFLLPRITGLQGTWNRINHGDPFWLGVAILLECCSFLGYVLLFRTVFVRGQNSRIDWRESYQITMAGLAATRLFAAAGAGGVVLTAWALRRSGMEPRLVACRMVAFMVILYTVFVSALVITGVGLRIGLFNGPAPFAITVVPAIFGAVLIVLMLAMALVPGDLERRLAGWAQGRGRLAHLARRLATVPATVATGVRTALGLVRDGEFGLVGALLWWGFDIAVLWACFHAFGGDPPPIAALVLAYFVGTLGNLLPLPGGIGGVDGAMIGALAALDVPTGLAVVSVLTYRAIAFWAPTIPGAIAYFQLRRTVQRWKHDPAPAAVMDQPSAVL